MASTTTVTASRPGSATSAHSKPESKPEYVTDFSEFDNNDEENAKDTKLVKTLDSVRLCLTAIAVLSAITVVGTAGDALANYNSTKLSSDYILSIWPNEFDIRPTHAIVICSVIVLVSSLVSLVGIKVAAVRNNTLLNLTSSFIFPAISLIAALIGTSFFYGVNGSATNYSLQSWSCQWAPIKMDTKPHWETLCKESKVALYLTVMWIPLQVLILSAAAFSSKKEKKTAFVADRKGSPAMS